MASDALVSIGDFARASGLSAKALRLYDEMGLLRPAEVDVVTGYRRYAPDQLDRARLVARLRLAGMPLARIRLVADLPPPAAVTELTSYGRQLAADTASARRQVAALVAELNAQEHDMATTTSTTGTTSTTSTTGSPPPARAASRTGIGGRDLQQDALLVSDGVYAVADGFGSATGPSSDAVGRLSALALAPDPVGALDAAVAAAAAALCEQYADHPGSGTTLTAVVLRDAQAFLVHVGDTRAYLVRSGRLERLTRDHTVVQTLVDEGRLSAEEARTDERRVQLNRAIAVDDLFLPDLAVHATRPGDRIVLTTDGVHGRVDPGALRVLLVADVAPDEVVASVERAVLAAGADDNYAVVVVDL